MSWRRRRETGNLLKHTAPEWCFNRPSERRRRLILVPDTSVCLPKVMTAADEILVGIAWLEFISSRFLSLLLLTAEHNNKTSTLQTGANVLGFKPVNWSDIYQESLNLMKSWLHLQLLMILQSSRETFSSFLFDFWIISCADLLQHARPDDLKKSLQQAAWVKHQLLSQLPERPTIWKTSHQLLRHRDL